MTAITADRRRIHAIFVELPPDFSLITFSPEVSCEAGSSKQNRN